MTTLNPDGTIRHVALFVLQRGGVCSALKAQQGRSCSPRAHDNAYEHVGFMALALGLNMLLAHLDKDGFVG